MREKLCVLGLGYMGLPTASLFANQGFTVLGVDLDQRKIDALNRKEVYIEEKGLKEVVQQALNSGNLRASLSLEEADVFIVAVPTPLEKENKKAELKYVKSATEMISSVLKKGDLVILESTVPPKTCKEVMLPILEKTGLKVGEDFLISHCPERAIPGNTMFEMINNDRIIGGINSEASEKTRELYSNFCKGQIFLTDVNTAEAVKLMENTYRDVNIALANELAKLSKSFGINVWEAIKLANRHPRVNIHTPGPGVGGHCIAIDPWFLVGEKKAPLINYAREINDSMPQHVIDLINNELGHWDNVNVAVLGAAYKADVDDCRESPSLEITKLCEEKGWNVKIHDPFVEDLNLELDEVLKDADCVVLATDHTLYKDFSGEDFSKFRNKLVIDTRNCFNKEISNMGLKLVRLGDHNENLYSNRD